MAKKGIPKKDGSGGGIRSNKNTKPCKNGGPGGSKVPAMARAKVGNKKATTLTIQPEIINKMPCWHRNFKCPQVN